MGLENVVSDILEQARTEVAAIDAAAGSEVEDIINVAQVEAQKIIETKEAEVDVQIERMRMQEISSTNLEIKRAALNAKKKVLETVFQSVRETIISMPVEKKRDLIRSILDKNSNKGTRVYSNSKDTVIVKELTDLTYMGEIDCIGGLVIENDDGSIRLDFTFDRILDDVSDQTLKQISDIIFE